MRKLLTLAIPLLLGGGVLTALVHSDPQSGVQSTRRQAGVADMTKSLPAVIEEAAAQAHPATAPGAAPQSTTPPLAPTTTTTAAPATTTTTARPKSTTPTTARPRPTTTTTAPAPMQAASPQPQVIDCGTGTASAKANLVHPASNTYALTATVLNESTKAIELD